MSTIILKALTNHGTRKQRHTLPEKVKIKVNNALILSLVDYCHLTRGTTIKYNTQNVAGSPREFIRIIANVPRRSTTNALFQTYDILKAESIFNFRLLITYRNAVKK